MPLSQQWFDELKELWVKDVWLVRANVASGQCVRFATADSLEEANAIAERWRENNTFICVETEVSRTIVDVEVIPPEEG